MHFSFHCHELSVLSFKHATFEFRTNDLVQGFRLIALTILATMHQVRHNKSIHQYPFLYVQRDHRPCTVGRVPPILPIFLRLCTSLQTLPFVVLSQKLQKHNHCRLSMYSMGVHFSMEVPPLTSRLPVLISVYCRDPPPVSFLQRISSTYYVRPVLKACI